MCVSLQERKRIIKTSSKRVKNFFKDSPHSNVFVKEETYFYI